MDCNSTKPSPFLWFKDDMHDAVTMYTSIFKDGKIDETDGPLSPSSRSVTFHLAGLKFYALSGRPGACPTFSPAVSFFVSCSSEDEINNLWAKLSDGGMAFMPIDNYGFSQRFVHHANLLSWKGFPPAIPSKMVGNGPKNLN
jgi:predicted 3-demethylubiquinone-9 3-methyltransferase (glyoxalase superfamily)